MGESVPAADISEIRALVARYLHLSECAIISTKQVSPDATVFKLRVDGKLYFLLEEDYVADLEWVVARFNEYGLKRPQLQRVTDPPEAFDYEPYLKAQPDYFSKDGDDFNRLRLYETAMRPKKLRYEVYYYLAQEAAQ